MSDLRKAAEMALKALVSSTGELRIHLASPTDTQLEKNYAAIEILRQALAQLEQEPAAWITECQEIGPNYGKKRFNALPIQSLNPLMYKHTPLYTAPPKREWVGLTRRELDIATLGLEDLSDCYKAIEAKLKEKNT